MSGGGARLALTLAVCACAGFSLAACEQVFWGGTAYYGYQLTKAERLNLRESSYAAADYMDQQLRHFASRHTRIRAVPLNELNEPQLTSAIGTLIPEQAGTRLAQLGYNVDLQDVTPAAGRQAMMPERTGMPSPIVLTGTYVKRRRYELDVHLSIVNTGNGQVMAAFDYTVPITVNIEKMTTPKPLIYRVEE